VSKLLQTNDAINMLEELAHLVMIHSDSIILLRRANDAIHAIEQHDLELGETEDERERVANDNSDIIDDIQNGPAEDYDIQYGEYNE
jgi:hypothetical protein